MSFNELNTTLAFWLVMIRQNVLLSFEITAGLWVVQLVNVITGKRLNRLGILPRRPLGLIGIIFSPFLHADWNHLICNTIPLILLLNLILVYGLGIYIYLTLFVMLVSGLLIWLLGRNAIHIGASGVIMGYWSFVTTMAWITKEIIPIIIAGICMIYLWGLALSLLPKKGESWEGHVFGCLAGVVFAYFFIPGS